MAKKKSRGPTSGWGMGVGIAVGAGIGIAMQHLAIGIGIGVAIGAAMESISRKSAKDGGGCHWPQEKNEPGGSATKKDEGN